MDELFDLPPAATHLPEPEERGRPRLQRPRREQITLRPSDLESLLPPEHRARLVWAFVEGLDLSAFHARIRATEGHSGRPPIDPAILVSLWLYATLEAVGSARALDRLCDEHDAYRWICGGVGVNYHTLADFRIAAAELLDELLAQSVAALLATGDVTLVRVAHDGVRVRASAGAGSYRGRRGLERALTDASAQVAALRTELDDDPAATSRRAAAARERAAREREARVRAALEALPGLEAAKARARARSGKGRPVSEARASTTDPEARVMRMGDGGYRPAYNGQLTTDVGSGLVCGVDVTSQGTDAGELGPALERLERAFGRRPAEMLADGGYVSLAEIEDLAACGTVLYAPPMTGRPRRHPRSHEHPDSPAVAAWRERMATDEGHLVYRLRAASAEWVNALARNRGLQQYRVRGLEKVRSVLLWFALAHNLDRTLAIRAGATG
ncbi:MAG TPA: IS1182 family transposase [Patescibacteria group bacterium]|nr:IS1182 family transposase [Patescibacteria group bacterium]